MIAATLDKAIRAVCPIDGVSIGRPADKATWRIHFRPEATPGQRAAAGAVLAAFDPASVPPPPEPRDLVAEIDALKARNAKLEAALAAKGVVAKEEIDAAAPARGDVK